MAEICQDGRIILANKNELERLIASRMTAQGAPMEKVRQDIEYVREALKGIAGYLGVNSTGYFSQIQYLPAVAAGPPLTYTMPVGVRQAFNYSVGGSMLNAGFPATPEANNHNTNLSQASKTRDNETYFIHGFQIIPQVGSEPVLMAHALAYTGVEITLNGGSKILQVGRMDFAGKIFGEWTSTISPPPIDSAFTYQKFGQSAYPEPDSTFWFEGGPLIWRGTGSSDSQLVFNFRLNQAFSFSATPRAADPMAPYLQAWSPNPAPYATFTVKLVGIGINDPSLNQV